MTTGRRVVAVGFILVVTFHPVHNRSLVPAFGREVKEVVGADEDVDAPRI
jgi:hypothetical protein